MMCQCTFFVYLFKQNYFKTHVKKKTVDKPRVSPIYCRVYDDFL